MSKLCIVGKQVSGEHEKNHTSLSQSLENCLCTLEIEDIKAINFVIKLFKLLPLVKSIPSISVNFFSFHSNTMVYLRYPLCKVSCLIYF